MSEAKLRVTDHWFVTNGVVAVGPMGFEQLRQRVTHGRVPPTSFVRHETWKVWRRLDEIQELSPGDRIKTVRRLASISAHADERASDPLSQPPPPLTVEPRPYMESSDSYPPLSAIRPAAVDPVGVLSRAQSLEDALLLTLSTAVAASKADIGLLHWERRELGVLVTSYANGSNAELLLGDRLPESDPSVLAARAGRTILGEPQLGDAGRYIAGRLARCLGAVRGVAMVPLLVYGRLIAMVEVGRADSPFRAREIARIEDVIEALTGRAVVSGWVD